MSGFSTFRTRLKNQPEAQCIMPMQINEIQNDPGTLRWCHIWWFSHSQFFENFKTRKNWHTKNVRIFDFSNSPEKASIGTVYFIQTPLQYIQWPADARWCPAWWCIHGLYVRNAKKKQKNLTTKNVRNVFCFSICFFYRTRILQACY